MVEEYGRYCRHVAVIFASRHFQDMAKSELLAIDVSFRKLAEKVRPRSQASREL